MADSSRHQLKISCGPYKRFKWNESRWIRSWALIFSRRATLLDNSIPGATAFGRDDQRQFAVFRVTTPGLNNVEYWALDCCRVSRTNPFPNLASLVCEAPPTSFCFINKYPSSSRTLLPSSSTTSATTSHLPQSVIARLNLALCGGVFKPSEPAQNGFT